MVFESDLEGRLYDFKDQDAFKYYKDVRMQIRAGSTNRTSFESKHPAKIEGRYVQFEIVTDKKDKEYFDIPCSLPDSVRTMLAQHIVKGGRCRLTSEELQLHGEQVERYTIHLYQANAGKTPAVHIEITATL